MKKAKMMLSALAIVGVLGGAFAFKAQSFSTKVIFTGAYDGIHATGACQNRVTGKTITNSGATVYASTTSLASGCPSTFTTVANPD
jgi:hypothetical protein